MQKEVKIDEDITTWVKGELTITTSGRNYQGQYCEVFTAQNVMDVRKIYKEKECMEMHFLYIRVGLGYRSERENATVKVKAGDQIFVNYPRSSELIN